MIEHEPGLIGLQVLGLWGRGTPLCNMFLTGYTGFSGYFLHILLQKRTERVNFWRKRILCILCILSKNKKPYLQGIDKDFGLNTFINLITVSKRGDKQRI
jgi:hypothetical protein